MFSPGERRAPSKLIRIRRGPHPLDLDVEEYGDPSDPTILLICGLGVPKEVRGDAGNISCPKRSVVAYQAQRLDTP